MNRRGREVIRNRENEARLYTFHTGRRRHCKATEFGSDFVRLRGPCYSFRNCFGCGFFCYGSPCDTGYLFATFFVVYNIDGELFDMEMVWSSNRDQMVQENATLTLTSTGELVLRNSDGTFVWSANTSTQAFQKMVIRESGNLVLYNTSGGIIWQSFDYPTDTLLRGQKLKAGKKITANISHKNTSQGRFYCTLLHDSFAMFTASAPAKMYFRYPEPRAGVEFSYIQFDNQSVHIYSQGGGPQSINLSVSKTYLYFRLDSDGHLRVCSILQTTGRSSPDYLPSFMRSVAECDYPRPCGDYGVCTNGQCSCPTNGNAFKPIDVTEPNFGCVPRVPLVCSDKSGRKDHHFLELEHVSYFTYVFENASRPGLMSSEECKKLCLEDCSCKAAFFRYKANFSTGYCYLESNIYSMKTNSPVDEFYNSTAYIKIQSTSKRSKYLVVVIICASVGGALALLILLWAWINKSQTGRQQTEKDENDGEHDHVDWPAGLPLRFSFQELQDATNGFSINLGKGGFGSVYEGVLADGSKIAVKRLDGAGQGEREFRAEVETLGKIDHLNLVRLKGFCAEKAHRMLVYEELSKDGLFSLLRVKAEEGSLIDLVYPGHENEQNGVKEEAIKLLKVGMWCVQDNFTRRPAMSIVVKALEGLIDTFDDVPWALAGLTVASDQQSLFSSELSYAPITCVLSGPR
ncbi:hypothetical protein SUGI_1492890 [Cryptomeria japonica]|uniref:Receptor-like serine/threonine-protein kinase n=1 Tax=Cryptomeria japonica TaxID=3369 RepID=A0AAD3NUM2_CRYJA|nr:hypothetical protein SUGI_1492890 [Cryptomeria japonica]